MCVSGGRGGVGRWRFSLYKGLRCLSEILKKKTMIGGNKILFCEHGLKFNPLLRGANSISKAL